MISSKASAAAFIVRPFRRADATAVAGMLVKLAAFHGDRAPRKPQDFIAQALGPRKLASVWVAVADRKIVGFVSTLYAFDFLRSALVVRMDFFYVEEAYRRSGIGTALTQTVFEDSVRRGCTRFIVGAMPNNKVSNAFYEKLGLPMRRKDHVDYFADGALLKKLARSPKGKKK